MHGDRRTPDRGRLHRQADLRAAAVLEEAERLRVASLYSRSTEEDDPSQDEREGTDVHRPCSNAQVCGAQVASKALMDSSPASEFACRIRSFGNKCARISMRKLMRAPFFLSHRMHKSLGCGRFIAGLLLAGFCSAATLPFYDGFENGLANWLPGGSWGLTTAHYASPGHAATDSPGSFYTNNTDSALALAVSLDLSGATRPALSFQHQYALEAGFDFGYVEVSTNGGSAWLAPAVAAYTGNLGAMSREQLDLSAYTGVTALRLRFRIVTDLSVVMDGWYVDDVRVAEAPAPVTLRATQTNRNSVALAWGQSASPGFAAYRLYRSLSPGVDWHTARLVAEITSNSTTNVTDMATSPKSRYYYRLAVVNTEGMLTLGNEIAVTTLAGMDYPFVDNGEGGGGTWIPDTPWALSDEDAASPTHAWSDSPGGNYTNGIASQSLTLAAPVYLAGQAKSPALCFNHKYDFAPGDSANLEVLPFTG
jgi:hypothetical protein